MDLYARWLPGAVCVLPFQGIYEAVLQKAVSWDEVLGAVLAELSGRMKLFPNTANWVLLVRHGTATRYQHWRAVVAMEERSCVDWKDEMLAFLAHDTGPVEPLGRTSFGMFVTEARRQDIAGITALQADEGGLHKRFSVAYMDRICPLPGPVERAGWLQNPFIVANLLLPFLACVLNSGVFVTELARAVGTDRALCVALDGAFLPTQGGHAECTRDTSILCASRARGATTDTISLFRGEDLCAASGWLEYSCDPLPREAMWLLLCGLHANRDSYLWTDGLAGGMLYMMVLDHLRSVYASKRGENAKALLPSGWSCHEPKYLRDLLAGRTRALLVAANGESWQDLVALTCALMTAYGVPGSSVAHAAVVSGLLVKEAGVPEMLHDICAQKAGLFGHKLRLCVRRDAPSKLGVYFPWVRGDARATHTALADTGRTRGRVQIDVITSAIVPTVGSSTISSAAVRDYLHACHANFIINYLLGEVYRPFSRLPHLAPDAATRDSFGFKTWLAAVRRCRSFDTAGLPPVDRAQYLHDLTSEKREIAERYQVVGV